MKTLIVSLLVLVAVAVENSSAAADPPDTSRTPTGVAIRLATATNDGWKISRGASVQTLLNRFGAPDTQLSENIWAYRRYHAVQAHPDASKCTTLLVTLADGVVTDLFLVDERAEGIIARRVQAGSPALFASSP